MRKIGDYIATTVTKLANLTLVASAYLIPLIGSAQNGGGGNGGSGGGGGVLEGLADLGGWLAMPFTWVLAKFSEFIFWLVGFFSTMAASLMNWSVEFFVLQMPELIEEMDAINTLWAVLRDIGNMVFIFLILFAAISIILDNDKFDAKNILIKVFVVALFVNFSLFITQVVVDVSNVLALQIYENISTPGGGDANLANVIASQLNLSSLSAEPSWSQLANEGGVYSKLAIARLFGAVLNFAVGFVMIAIAALLGIRFLVLVLLMVGSPIAFVAFTLPNASFGQDWWDWLIRESFFAPALMLMLYITFYLARNLKEGLGLGTNSQLMKAIIEPSGNVGIVAFFGVVIGMLVASIIIARQMGATGADKVASYGKSVSSWGQAKITGGAKAAGGWGAREIVGRLGKKMDSDEVFKGSRLAKKYPYMSKQIRKGTTGKMKNASFGMNESYDQVRKERKQAERDVAEYDEKQRTRRNVMGELESIDKALASGKYDKPEAKQRRRQQINKLSTDQKIDEGSDWLKKHAELLSEKDLEKIEESEKYDAEEVREIKEKAVETLDKVGGSGPDPSESEIKEYLSSRSDEHLKEIDFEVISKPKVVQNMSSDQFETALKNKTDDQKDEMTKHRLQPLKGAVMSPDPDDVSKELEDKKDKEIAKLLKKADSGIRTDDGVIDEVSPKVLSELADELSSKDKDELRSAVKSRYSSVASPTDKNDRANDWLTSGTGKAVF